MSLDEFYSEFFQLQFDILQNSNFQLEVGPNQVIEALFLATKLAPTKVLSIAILKCTVGTIKRTNYTLPYKGPSWFGYI